MDCATGARLASPPDPQNKVHPGIQFSIQLQYDTIPNHLHQLGAPASTTKPVQDRHIKIKEGPHDTRYDLPCLCLWIQYREVHVVTELVYWRKSCPPKKCLTLYNSELPWTSSVVGG